MQSITGMEWLKKQIEELEVTSSAFKEQIKQITQIDPETYNEFRAIKRLKYLFIKRNKYL